MNWVKKTILLIGGTGSFGSNFLDFLVNKYRPKVIRIYSRDEYKQSLLLQKYDHNLLRGFIGDIRDLDRLRRAMEGVDIVVHAAALKQVQSCEYNPFEAVKTNIIGGMNIIEASLDCNVEKVIAISTDKAVQPLNLYGATKMCMEKLFIRANSYRGSKKTKFCCTRYGNVVNSRGSVIPYWKELIKQGKPITITDSLATRFWLTVGQANKFITECIELMDSLDGGEILIPKLPSVKIMDIYTSLVDNNYPYEVIGNRVGDKLHESLISKDEVKHTISLGRKFIVYPELPEWNYDLVKGSVCEYRDGYRSDNNEEWLDIKAIKKTLEENN